MFWITLRSYIREYLRTMRALGPPPRIEVSEYVREVDLRLAFEIRYWLLMKKTGKKVTTAEAQAWFADQMNDGWRIKEMHAALMPEGYQPLTRRQGE